MTSNALIGVGSDILFLIFDLCQCRAFAHTNVFLMTLLCHRHIHLTDPRCICSMTAHLSSKLRTIHLDFTEEKNLSSGDIPRILIGLRRAPFLHTMTLTADCNALGDEQLSHFKSLRSPTGELHLNVERNQLTSLSDVTQLAVNADLQILVINAAFNNIVRVGPLVSSTHVSRLKELELGLWCNRIDDLIAQEFACIGHALTLEIIRLDLRANYIGDIGLRHIVEACMNLKLLHTLCLSVGDCCLTNQCISHVAMLRFAPALRKLDIDLSHNELRGPAFDELGALGLAPQLRRLKIDLALTGVCDSDLRGIVKGLGCSQHLGTINISLWGGQIGNTGACFLAELHNVRALQYLELNLRDTNVDVIGIDHLVGGLRKCTGVPIVSLCVDTARKQIVMNRDVKELLLFIW